MTSKTAFKLTGLMYNNPKQEYNQFLTSFEVEKKNLFYTVNSSQSKGGFISVEISYHMIQE